MKLAEYAIYIAKLAKKHPKATVVFVNDEDEEARCYPVAYNPTSGKFTEGEWISNDGTKKFKVNAVCVN